MASPHPPIAVKSAHFRDTTPQMTIARKIYFKIVVGGCFSLILAILAIFSIYWGALWKIPARPLQGWVVDFDGDTIGSTVVNSLVNSQTTLHFTQVSADQFSSPEDVGAHILEEKSWFAIVIHPGATANLNNAVQSIDASYDGTSAITLYGTEARQENAFRSFISPIGQSLLNGIGRQFATQHAQTLASSSSASLAEILSNAPQLVTAPLGFTIGNMAPFDIPVASAITFVGLIYLLILSFFIVMVQLSAREVSGLDRHLQTKSLIGLRLGTVFVSYFFISLFYSFLSLAFQVDFSKKFGHGGFVVFWILNYVGMLSVGLALEAMVTLLTTRFVPFFMILWIIINVSVCFMPIDLQPILYRYGYAVPFYNVSRGVRTILFGTKNTLGLNFGVLIAWAVISLITLPLFQWLRRRNMDSGGVAEDGGEFQPSKELEGERRSQQSEATRS